MPDLRERLLHPREGWQSLGLVMVMLFALGWSVQGATWLPRMEFLVPLALWASLLGALLGVLPLSVVAVLPVSAVVGTGVVLWAIGGEYFTALDQVGRQLALREEFLSWTVDIVRGGYPAEVSPTAIVMGLVMWSTSFIAAYAVFRHHRVFDAILLVGVLIIANMAATFADLFAHLLIFVIAALLLWLRAALTSRQESWQRRRVNENLEVPGSILRSGVAFGVGSVALAWVLTTVAVAAPLTEAWRGLDDVWVGVRDRFENVFSNLTNPQARITGNSFGAGFVVDGEWVSNDAEALRLVASRSYYLRTGTYDRYTGRGMERTDGERRVVEAGVPLFRDIPTAERPYVDEGFDLETVVIEMRGDVGRNIFVPGYPLRIHAPVEIHESDNRPVLGGLQARSSLREGEAYAVDAAIPNTTQAQLRLAGEEYPADVTALYLDASRATQRVVELAREITDGLETPYDRAEALAAFLRRDPRFSYSTSAPVPQGDQDLVDFFLFDENGQVGFCQYYATTMMLMARAVGIPARVAVGFAPGEPAEDGSFIIREANAHAWAELYFPGYGWQIFESTKSINPRFTRPTGDPAAAPPPQPRTGDSLLELFENEPLEPGELGPLPSFNPVEGGIDPNRDPALPADEGSSSGGNALLLLIIAALAIAAAWYQMRRTGRRLRLLPAGARTWKHLELAAQRAGVGQRPSETIYEYSGWLEEQIPARRGDIRTIADGKVWQSYSGRKLSRGAAVRVEAAWRRLRMPFARLTVRQWVRGLLRR